MQTVSDEAISSAAFKRGVVGVIAIFDGRSLGLGGASEECFLKFSVGLRPYLKDFGADGWLVFNAIALCVDKSGLADPSVPYLCRASGLGRNRVFRALAKLCGLQLAAKAADGSQTLHRVLCRVQGFREDGSGKKHFGPNVYRIFPTDVEAADADARHFQSAEVAADKAAAVPDAPKTTDVFADPEGADASVTAFSGGKAETDAALILQGIGDAEGLDAEEFVAPVAEADADLGAKALSEQVSPADSPCTGFRDTENRDTQNRYTNYNQGFNENQYKQDSLQSTHDEEPIPRACVRARGAILLDKSEAERSVLADAPSLDGGEGFEASVPEPRRVSAPPASAPCPSPPQPPLPPPSLSTARPRVPAADHRASALGVFLARWHSVSGVGAKCHVPPSAKRKAAELARSVGKEVYLAAVEVFFGLDADPYYRREGFPWGLFASQFDRLEQRARTRLAAEIAERERLREIADSGDKFGANDIDFSGQSGREFSHGFGSVRGGAGAATGAAAGRGFGGAASGVVGTQAGEGRGAAYTGNRLFADGGDGGQNRTVPDDDLPWDRPGDGESTAAFSDRVALRQLAEDLAEPPLMERLAALGCVSRLPSGGFVPTGKPYPADFKW